jgi:hypothetical protein
VCADLFAPSPNGWAFKSSPSNVKERGYTASVRKPMKILPFHLKAPTEVILERPEGTLVQGRYGDRVMFSLADGRVMYVPPFVATKIQAEGVAAGERFELCKTQARKGSRRSIE